jgi:4-phytase / acid phosphatase
MSPLKVGRLRALAAAIVALAISNLCAGSAQADSATDTSTLLTVVVISRHGVRSPTHPHDLDAYSSRQWPAWNVPPGYLTPHGAKLMQGFGAAYRNWYGTEFGWAASACPPDGAVTVWADVDERTRATGRAVADGFAPGCNVAVGSATTPEDPLFDPPGRDGDPARADAAVLGAIGGDASSVDVAYGANFAALRRVMGGRALPATTFKAATQKNGAGLAGGLDLAADAAENLLLEYTDGKTPVGWGSVDRATLLQLLQLHVLAKRVEHNRYASQLQSTAIVQRIATALQQRTAKFVFLSGHDTQLEEISAMFGLSWLVPDDQMNDTPPGSALVWEVRSNAGGTPFVRTYFAEQSLDDMRAGVGDRPLRVPVYVPGCPALDCPLPVFESIVDGAVLEQKYN